ncbi:MAG: N-acetylmuramoyl-L-alanine amidase [Pseudomonadota bacterium]|nr:N-acetylmuramoyl-L-alanine amidase [Pseudomonadota bacterium]
MKNNTPTVSRRKFLLQILAAAGTLPNLAFADIQPKNKLVNAHLSENKGHAKVVFYLKNNPNYQIFTLTDPNRLVIDFYQTILTTPITTIPTAGAFVRRLRYASHHPGAIRVVLDLAGPANPISSVMLPGSGSDYYRFIVDVNHPDSISENSKPILKNDEKLRNVIVAIDPGHGGKDPGATGKYGTHEKNIVLSMGEELSDLMKDDKGINTFLTRDRDVFIPLGERVQIAHQQKADLFISIHADASIDRNIAGSSVYILSPHGASSVMARKLAERENSADLVGGINLSSKDPLLASVLLDLTQSATINSSGKLATHLLESISRTEKIFSPRVERAGFAVLKSPDTPSVLVETAFISNPAEEHKLCTPRFQSNIVHAIRAGIHEYFHHNAPNGTFIAAFSQDYKQLQEF